jgi:hypothetical protein
MTACSAIVTAVGRVEEQVLERRVLTTVPGMYCILVTK